MAAFVRVTCNIAMFSTAIRRTAQQPIPYIYTNPYKAKHLWPPDFAKLSPKHQFRLERRYKRRAKLKWARPRWTKGVKMVQMAAVTFIAVYGVLFLDWKQEGGRHPPFEGIRSWFWGLTGSIWTKDQVRKPMTNKSTSSVTVTDK